MSEPTRRSGRKRTQNKRYTNDVVVNFQDLIESGDESPSPVVPVYDDADEDEEFHDEPPHDEEDEASLSDDDFGKATNKENKSDKSGFSTPDEGNEDPTDAVLSLLNPKPRGPKARKRDEPKEDDTHSRGLLYNKFSISKNSTAKDLAGSDPNDIEPLLRERKKWIDGPILPLRMPDPKGVGGMDYPFVYSEAMRDRAADTFHHWYLDQRGHEKIVKVQNATAMKTDQANLYVPHVLPSHTVLLGPYGRQKAFEIPAAGSLSLSESWEAAEAEGNIPEHQRSAPQSRHGWVLNLGDRIRSLDWAPNHDGDTQYLAIATASEPPPELPKVSAFEPVQPYAASFSIWAFKSREEDSEHLVDLAVKPWISQLACTDWGGVRRLQWCPAASPAVNREEVGAVSLGLLAGIWTDGFVRVLDIRVNTREDPKRRVGDNQSNPVSSNLADAPSVHYSNVAFAARPPNTICTCLSWISATELAVGHANGFVAVWDIADHIVSLRSSWDPATPAPSPSPSDSDCPVPTFYHPVSVTYILSITAHHPFPTTLITTTAADGRTRLTSLAYPGTDTIAATRVRAGVVTPLTYSLHIFSAIAPDENDTVRALPLRSFFASRSLARATASIMCLDAGKCHPCLLIGSSDGAVVVTNPLRRLYLRKDGKAGPWQMVWFQSEWVSKERQAELREKREREEQQQQQEWGQDKAQSVDGEPMDGVEGTTIRSTVPATTPHPLDATAPQPSAPSNPSNTAPQQQAQAASPIPFPRPGTSRQLTSFKPQNVPIGRNVANHFSVPNPPASPKSSKPKQKKAEKKKKEKSKAKAKRKTNAIDLLAGDAAPPLQDQNSENEDDDNNSDNDKTEDEAEAEEDVVEAKEAGDVGVEAGGWRKRGGRGGGAVGKAEKGKEKEKEKGARTAPIESLAYDTLYEEEQAVTCVAWNPNPRVGGWAAAGLANGVVRVEDLGV